MRERERTLDVTFNWRVPDTPMRKAFDVTNSIRISAPHAFAEQLQRTYFHNLAGNALHANISTNVKTNNQPFSVHSVGPGKR